MDLSAAQHQQLPHNFSHHQESESLDSMIGNSKSPADNNQQQPDQKKPRPPETEPQQCPRCESTNTKFCYYNNYSLTQPRYFCKACRRYWTKGGTLRNVPVGGGCRKSAKRASSASNSPSQFLKRVHTGDDMMASAPAPNPVFSGLNSLHGYGGGMGWNANFTDIDAGVGSFLGHPNSGMSFLQDLQYGNGGFMFQSNLCNYDDIGAGNSNCVSGVSDDVAAMAPYDDVSAVKHERGWELPWQSDISGGEVEAVRENWNGLIGNYSALGLLNTSALM